jgi:hypothetical protein
MFGHQYCGSMLSSGRCEAYPRPALHCAQRIRYRPRRAVPEPIYSVPEELQHEAPFTNMAVVIESGAIIDGVDTPETLVDSSLNVVCMPGSFRKRGDNVN